MADAVLMVYGVANADIKCCSEVRSACLWLCKSTAHTHVYSYALDRVSEAEVHPCTGP